MAWPDLFVVKDFFDSVVCNAIVAEMKAVQGSAATVYGRGASGSIDANVRKTLRVVPSNETIEMVMQRLRSSQHALEKHFDLTLNECEVPQFLRYGVGDFFVAHQDGNTGLLQLETERRRVSIVIFLSRESDSFEPNTHSGGSLVFSRLHGPGVTMRGEPGTLVAFRSEATHEVTPVTRGERLSIVSWFK